MAESLNIKDLVLLVRGVRSVCGNGGRGIGDTRWWTPGPEISTRETEIVNRRRPVGVGGHGSSVDGRPCPALHFRQSLESRRAAIGKALPIDRPLRRFKTQELRFGRERRPRGATRPAAAGIQDSDSRGNASLAVPVDCPLQPFLKSNRRLVIQHLPGQRNVGE